MEKTVVFHAFFGVHCSFRRDNGYAVLSSGRGVFFVSPLVVNTVLE